MTFKLSKFMQKIFTEHQSVSKNFVLKRQDREEGGSDKFFLSYLHCEITEEGTHITWWEILQSEFMCPLLRAHCALKARKMETVATYPGS